MYWISLDSIQIYWNIFCLVEHLLWIRSCINCLSYFFYLFYPVLNEKKIYFRWKSSSSTLNFGQADSVLYDMIWPFLPGVPLEENGKKQSRVSFVLVWVKLWTSNENAQNGKFSDFKYLILNEFIWWYEFHHNFWTTWYKSLHP